MNSGTFQAAVPQQPHKPLQVPTVARAFAISDLAAGHAGCTLVLAADSHEAAQLEADLSLIVDQSRTRIVHFPEWETLPYDIFSPHPDIVSQRLRTLATLHELERYILVIPAPVLMQRLLPRSFLAGFALNVRTDDEIDLANLRAELLQCGYRLVPQTDHPGEFAVRGSILDVFPMGSTRPYRIDLFDEEIDSIRYFDPETQRSLEQVDEIRMLPAAEFPLDEEGIRSFRRRFRKRFEQDLRKCTIYRDIKDGVLSPGIEYYLPLFFDRTECLFDYLPSNTIAVDVGGYEDACKQFWKQLEERYEQRRYDLERPLLAPAELYLDPGEISQQLGGLEITGNNDAGWRADLAASFGLAPDLPVHQKNTEPGAALHAFLGRFKGRVLIAASSAGRREVLLQTLGTMAIRPTVVDSWIEFLSAEQSLCIADFPLSDGVGLKRQALVIITENQLFEGRIQQRRARSASRPGMATNPENIIRDLTDLHIGAPVVHRDHGVGRYQGLQSMTIGQDEDEYLVLEYAGADKLYVPVASLHLINRYSGAAPENAPLHTLGGDRWLKIRKKAAAKAHDVAVELLDVQARRAAKQGYAIKTDAAALEEFAAGFPFEETPDQIAAIETVSADLCKTTPMDRVICGDVGFGKTEVALRAAFEVTNAGRQVAVLVPTTLLAQQHFQNFSDRFADWPVRVAVVSRLAGKKASDKAIKDTRSGQVDILIGTHRLLQKDVVFKDLGLVVIDEEQRFGVRQKERFKALRSEVDLLTLTATPIPRTLNMSLAGMRDLSIIATPPQHRMAVKTFIGEWDSALIREACQRELQRGGQVFFLHNQVQTIEHIAEDLASIVPQARIAIAHGQMPERDLERVMSGFYRQKSNLLVCTTIIENGIDIPTANTIIMNRADKLGLAQLHQLRGRVGRSHHRAYAYLLVPDKRAMTRDALKRLEAVASLEELGAGFTLATHDMEIRGAGELLGEGQSGQIQEVGFALYNELLQQAVHSLKTGEIPEQPSESSRCEVELAIPAIIPEDYLPDVHTRLTLYKRVASCSSTQALRELQVEMIDRFGLLADATKNLFAINELRIMAEELSIRKLEFTAQKGKIQFRAKPEIDPARIIALVQDRPDEFSFAGPNTIKFGRDMETADHKIQAAHRVMGLL